MNHEALSCNTWPLVKIPYPQRTSDSIPTKIGSTMGGEFTYQPKWDPKAVLTTTADMEPVFQIPISKQAIVNHEALSCNTWKRLSTCAEMKRISADTTPQSKALGEEAALGSACRPFGCLRILTQNVRRIPFGRGQNRFGIPFWLVGEFTTHFRTYFSGD